MVLFTIESGCPYFPPQRRPASNVPVWFESAGDILMKQRPTKQSIRQNKQAKKEAIQREMKAQRFQQWGLSAFILLAVAIVGGIVIFLALNNGNQQVANATDTPSGKFAPVNGVSCDLQEHSQAHYHAHLSLYINNQAVTVPGNIGVSDSCLYWLHTHNSTGVVHIEAPKNQVYNLGTFVQIWASRFPELSYPSELNQTSGWSVFINGKPYDGDFRQLQFADHQVITLHYNSPNAPVDTEYNFG
jgi:hypothetical protein